MITSTYPKPSHFPITSHNSLYLPAVDNDEPLKPEQFGNMGLPNEATQPMAAMPDDPHGQTYFCAVPITGAMWPSYPAGRVVIFQDAQEVSPEDGATVYAALSVRRTPKPKRWWEWNKAKQHPHAGFKYIVAIRRYGHDEQGRITLTPLQPGFASWTQGEHDGQQAAVLILGVACHRKPRGFFINGVSC